MGKVTHSSLIGYLLGGGRDDGVFSFTSSSFSCSRLLSLDMNIWQGRRGC